MTQFDFSELTELSAMLENVPRGAAPRLRKALERTARNVKDGWNGKLYTAGHAKRTGRSVSYDLSRADAFGATVLEAEIGPLRHTGRQAGLVLLLENGSIHNAPHGFGAAALHEQEADFEHGLDVALAEAEREAGL